MNLADECGPMLGGAQIAQGQYNLRLTIETVLTLGSGVHWGLRVEKPRWSEKGRALKPEHVILLIGSHGEGPADLLQQLAQAWDQGEVEVAPAEKGIDLNKIRGAPEAEYPTPPPGWEA